jgi:hypothetical protein
LKPSLDLPPMPLIPWIGKRRAKQLNQQYEAARAAYRKGVRTMTTTITVTVNGPVQVRVGVTGDSGGEVVTMVRGDADARSKPVEAVFGLAMGALVVIGPETPLPVEVEQPIAEPPAAETKPAPPERGRFYPDKEPKR